MRGMYRAANEGSGGGVKMYKNCKLQNIKTVLACYGDKMTDKELTQIAIRVNAAKERIDKEERNNDR